jgi:hypothetical protein
MKIKDNPIAVNPDTDTDRERRKPQTDIEDMG